MGWFTRKREPQPATEPTICAKCEHPDRRGYEYAQCRAPNTTKLDPVTGGVSYPFCGHKNDGACPDFVQAKPPEPKPPTFGEIIREAEKLRAEMDQVNKKMKLEDENMAKPKPEPEVYADMMFRKHADGRLHRFRCIDGKGWEASGGNGWFEEGEPIDTKTLSSDYEVASEREEKVFCARCTFCVSEARYLRCSAKIKPKPGYAIGTTDMSELPYCVAVNPDGNCPYFKAKRSHRATRRTPKRKD